MARTLRLKKSGGTSRYHLISRTNDKRYLFKNGAIKTEIVNILKRVAVFSGIRLNAYTTMDNHFHVVCTVEKPADPVPMDELLRRYRVLYGARRAEALGERWLELNAAGYYARREEEMERLRHRMHDISEFIKTFKEFFNIWYKRTHDYCGSIWSGRFKSTLIEDGEYFRRCKRYVQLNAVRAGIVRQIRDYRWVWCEDDEKDATFVGSVPEAGLLRRVPQMGAGKVFGSEDFVRATLFALGDKLRTRSAGAHAVGELGYSSHGWRLAKGLRTAEGVA